MIKACDLGIARPVPVPDLDWPAEDAASLGHRAVDVWEQFLKRLPGLPVHHGASTAVAAGVAWDCSRLV
jgi:hypothetical protein